MFGLGGKKKRGDGMSRAASRYCMTNSNPGASSNKALIQKIPPSFGENPNEDLKCSAGRRPGGRGYTLPLLAFPAIVSLSPSWVRDGPAMKEA